VGDFRVIQMARATSFGGKIWLFVVSLDMHPSPLPHGVVRAVVRLSLVIICFCFFLFFISLDN
jgi:hypothetical protein